MSCLTQSIETLDQLDSRFELWSKYEDLSFIDMLRILFSLTKTLKKKL